MSNLIKSLLGGKAHLAASAAAEIDAVRARLEAMVRPAVALSFDKDSAVRADAHSSIGGAPSLPSAADWPVEAGRPMLFLAQINYAEMPTLAGYPGTGLLSFFVADDGESGCDFPSRDQSRFVTRYFEAPDALIRVPPPGEPELDMYGAHLRRDGAPLTGLAVTGYPTSALPEVERLVRDLSPEDADEICDWLIDGRPATLYYGGYPDFNQYDIRPSGAPETAVLLQQGHHYDRDRGWEICWGDAGEASFLIAPGDLADRQFARSIYTWDCS